MAKEVPGSATQDPYVQNAHTLSGLGKKTKYVDAINYSYDSTTTQYQDPANGEPQDYHTDLLRLDSKRNWTDDTITDAVSFSTHFFGKKLSTLLPGSAKTEKIKVSEMEYMPTDVTSYVTHVEFGKSNMVTVNHGSTTATSMLDLPSFNGSSQWFGDNLQEGTALESIVVKGRYTSLSAGDIKVSYDNIMTGDSSIQQKKRLATSFLRNNIVNEQHAKYVLYGIKSSQADSSGGGKGGPLYGDPSNFTAEQIVSYLIEAYEEKFGPIEPTFDRTKKYIDHYFDLPTLFDRDEREELQNLPSSLTFDVDPTYNFYDTTYENTITSGLDEIFIPNMYLILQGSYKNYPDPGLETLLTLGAAAVDESNFINDAGKKSDTAIAAEEYFKKFGESFGASGGAADQPGGISFVKEAAKGRNLGFLSKDVAILKDHNEKVNKFPMAATLRFSSQSNIELPVILKDTNYDYLVSKHAMLANISRQNGGELLGYKQVEFIKSGQFLGGGASSLKSYVIPRTAQVAHFGSLLNSFTAVGGSGTLYESLFQLETNTNLSLAHRFVGQIPDAFKGYNSSENVQGFFVSLMEKVTKQKVSALSTKKTRSYLDILKGKAAHGEIVIYKIAKHSVFNGDIDPNPMQQIYLSNSNEISEFIYNDTQVIYGQEYKYVIYAYTVVFGTEYVALPPRSAVSSTSNTKFFKNLGGSFEAKAKVLTRPSVQLIEIPYYGLEFNEPASVFIYDDPPMPPNIDIGGYRGVNNKILISLSNNFGSMITTPIAIEDNDNSIFNAVRAYQSLPSNLVAANKIRFQGDDPSGAFQVFRIGPDPVTGETKKPSSYTDFKGKKIKTVSYPGSDSASYVDRLQPNMKYYYVFRTIDVHGNISNPTVPYEVEMVSEPGSKLAYVIVREVGFIEKLKPTYKKSLKRFLHIDPREQHKYTSVSSLDDIDVEAAINSPPPLGVVADPLFVKKEHAGKARPRKFKVRLTSKRSGKKIDINVKFVHEHDKLKKA